MRVTRKTVLAVAGLVAAAALVAGLLWWLMRKGEGFEFAPDSTGVNEVDEDSPHAATIRNWCASGKTFGGLMKSKYAFLGKYTKGAAWKVCAPARTAWLEKAKSDDGKKALLGMGTVDLAKCGNGKYAYTACSVPALRVTHPCHNKTENRCCMYRNEWVPGSQNCVEKGGQLNKAKIASEILLRDNPDMVLPSHYTDL